MELITTGTERNNYLLYSTKIRQTYRRVLRINIKGVDSTGLGKQFKGPLIW
jgi:hypothetical protein